MKCPLKLAGNMAATQSELEDPYECLEEDGAWWDADKKCRAVLSAGRFLRFIPERLIDI